MLNKFLKYLGRSVYPYFLSGVENIFQGAELYLVDLKKSAPLSVFFTHFALALFLYLSPALLFVSIKPFPKLTREQRDQVMTRLKNFPLYPIRLAFFGVRGHALVAILRDAKARLHFGLQT